MKIWLFLKCVQFLKSCVQFLMDTILNLAIAQFLMKKKGDRCLVCASCIVGKGRHTNETRVSHLSKGRCTLWRRISLLLNMSKKNTHRLFFTGFSLRQHTACPLHTYAQVCVQTDTCGPGARSTAWSTSYLTSLKQLDCRGFKS
jgi:hypothetical protein